jgi:hypothetical protein
MECERCGKPVNKEDGAHRWCRACRRAAWEKLQKQTKGK